MSVDLFAGIAVTDFPRAMQWYEQLLDGPGTFAPNDTEMVWQLAEHNFIYIEDLPERAGHAMITVFVADLDQRLAGIAERGLQPDRTDKYDNGVRKAIFVDPDGNEVSFGGGPAE